MWITRPAAAALLVMMTGLPAMAQDIEIATLGRAPVMGSSRDSAELKRNFDNPANQRMLAQAGRKLGFTADEYSKFKEQVVIGNASWTAIPRHLDKMTWAADGLTATGTIEVSLSRSPRNGSPCKSSYNVRYERE